MPSSGSAMAEALAVGHDDAMQATSEPPSPSPEEPSRALTDRLFQARTVLIFGEIDAALAARACAELVALAAESEAPIRVLVSSPGGHVESADAIHDIVRYIVPDVFMVGSGWVASAGALIYIAAPPERRLALPNTRFLLHQPLGAVRGPASDVEIEAAQILQIRARLNRMFARATGQSVDRIQQDTERNHWMNAEQALAYGLVGRIIEHARDIAT